MTLPRLTTQWPEPWQYDYQERAGIKEFEGRMSRAQAEREAEQEMRGLAAREGPNSKPKGTVWGIKADG